MNKLKNLCHYFGLLKGKPIDKIIIKIRWFNILLQY
jgi:hypothetical protein